MRYEKRIVIYVDDELKQRLSDAAWMLRTSVTELIRTVMGDWLERFENKQT